MKTTSTKKIITFILLIAGMFSSAILRAQNCSGNKVWACRYDECGVQECKCVVASHVQEWMAQVPNCNLWHPNCCDGWRIADDNGNAAALNAYPNPVSPEMSGTTISFSLEQPQTVSIQVYDLSGRVVGVLAEADFGEGSHEVTWNADVNSGIYFLRLQSQEKQEMIKLIVTR